MAQKPSNPKGTRDFLPEVMLRRNLIFDTIKEQFIRYGYQAIETPALEKKETLMGKYGEEGDRLIFKLFPRGRKGDKLLEEKDASHIEEALRYDLTVPFARFVVQHQNELSFPFKRYQIQPVWRADKPQKGRYREFYQCDADVVGSNSLLFEVEFIHIYDKALSKLGLTDFSININNRKILSGIAEVCGESDRIIDITVAIDKLDKIGKEGVQKELSEKGFTSDFLEKIDPLFELSGSNAEKLEKLKSYLAQSEIGMTGINELEFILDKISKSSLENAKLNFDVTLARGLNYYTGAIFEVKAHGVSIGSIGGGGRYDDLTGIFGLKDKPGVGISFGADRIYDVLEELNLFPGFSKDSTQVLFINFGEAEADFCMQQAELMRASGINVEVYPESTKMQKQFKYADQKGIPYVVLAGSREIESEKVQVKNMASGEQRDMDVQSLKEVETWK
jgi:histidyl-tRNA synthetase